MSLSYSEDLWDDAGFAAICERVNQGNKTQDQIMSFLKDKISLENQSCAALNKMTKTNLGTYENGSLGSIVNAFVGLGVTTAVNHEILAAKLHEQVRNPLAGHAESIAKQTRKLLAEGKKLTRELRSAQQRLERAQSKYESRLKTFNDAKSARDLEQVNSKSGATTMAREQSNNSSIFQQLMNPTVDLEKMDTRVSDLKVDAAEAKEALVQSVSYMRGYRLSHDQQMARILDRLQKLERERRVRTGECLKHYFDVQRQMMESMVKNIVAVSRLMDDLSVDSDVQSFIANHKTGKKRPPLPELPGDNGDGEAKDDDSKTADQLSAEKEIQPLVNAVLADKTVPPEDLLKMEALFRTPDGRAAFAAILNNQRNVEAGLLLKGESFSVLARLIHMFLDNARDTLLARGNVTGKEREAVFASPRPPDRPKNAKTIRPAKLVMIMSQSFYRHIDSPKPSRGAAKRPLRSHNSSQILLERPAPPETVESDLRSARYSVLTKPDPGETAGIPYLSASPDVSFHASSRSDRTSVRSERLSDADTTSADDDNGAAAASSESPSRTAGDSKHDEVVGEADAVSSDEDPETKEVVETVVAAHAKRSSVVGREAGLAREYIQVAIASHPMWREIRFWEEAFYDSYAAELKKHIAVRRWHSQVERVEGERTRENILFSQLASWAHNMLQFGMELHETLDFVTKTCELNELDPQMVQMLMHMVTTEAWKAENASPRRNPREVSADPNYSVNGGGPSAAPIVPELKSRKKKVIPPPDQPWQNDFM